MTDKAYIVANKEQELEVLDKFEAKGLVWFSGDKPTEGITNEGDLFKKLIGFPYVLIEGVHVSWSSINRITDEEIVYDGRKEEKMYKVTQEFMNELIEWRDSYNLDAKTSWPCAFVDGINVSEFPEVVEDWWVDLDNPIDNNNRLIAIIQWLNGEDVFEVEEPHKFVVRSEHTDRDGDYIYVGVDYEIFITYRCDLNCATKFDTREEAQEWANSHQVVVEIDEEGNEVE